MMEKRATTRQAVTFPVELKVKKSSQSPAISLKGEIVDISQSGVALKLRNRLPDCSTASLHINHSPEHPVITIEARLVWNRAISKDGSYYYGLSFIEINEDSSLNLRRLLGYKTDHIVTASYLPERIVTNEDIIKMGFKGSLAALERGLGAKQRRAADSNETAADMMAKVAKKILDKAGCLPKELDYIICCSDVGDAVEPETATAVQAKINASCPAFGVSMSCTGWTMAVEIALQYLAIGKKRILILASSLVGSRTSFHNLMHRAIFGDGAGGILLESHHLSKFLATELFTKGEHYPKIFIPHPWSILPKDIPQEYKNSFYMAPDQKKFFDIMDLDFGPLVKRLLNKAKVDLKDIDIFLLHYPSKPLFEHSLKLLGVERSKTLSNFERYGNIAAAEIPVLIDEGINTGRIKKNNLIFILTYGAGITAGGMIMRY